MLQEATDKLKDIEVGGRLPPASGFTIREGDGTVVERDNAAVGDGDFEDIGGEVFEGCGPSWVSLTVYIRVDVADLRVDPFDKPGMLHLLFEDGAVDG